MPSDTMTLGLAKGFAPSTTGLYLECPECYAVYTHGNVVQGARCRRCGYDHGLRETHITVVRKAAGQRAKH